MKRRIIFYCLVYALTGCALGARVHTEPAQNTEKEFALPEKIEPPPPIMLNGRLWLPTLLHEKDQTLMVLVNAGNLDGTGKTVPQEKPKPSPVQAFYMDQLEITARKFSVFDPKYSEKPFTPGHRACPDCPALGIDWFRAREYCEWAGKRLPTEIEWETAARGQTDNAWPWGNAYLLNHANLHGEEDGHLLVAPVGSFPQGASPYGVLDMIGNVWEWVEDTNRPRSAGQKSGTRTIKGGGWTSSPETLNIAISNKADPTLKNPTFGFRCAKSLN